MFKSKEKSSKKVVVLLKIRKEICGEAAEDNKT